MKSVSLKFITRSTSRITLIALSLIILQKNNSARAEMPIVYNETLSATVAASNVAVSAHDKKYLEKLFKELNSLYTKIAKLSDNFVGKNIDGSFKDEGGSLNDYINHFTQAEHDLVVKIIKPLRAYKKTATGDMLEILTLADTILSNIHDRLTKFHKVLITNKTTTNGLVLASKLKPIVTEAQSDKNKKELEKYFVALEKLLAPIDSELAEMVTIITAHIRQPHKAASPLDILDVLRYRIELNNKK